MQHQPKLWFTLADVEALRRRIGAGEPTAAAIWKKAKALAQMAPQEVPEDSSSQYPEACAIVYLVEGDPAYARKAADYISSWTAGWTAAELTLAHWAMTTAIVHECCYEAWDEKTRVAMTRLLIKLFDGQREVEFHVGNPHDVTNNHWAVAHSGAGMAAMAAHGHVCDEAGTIADMSEHVAWARGRVKAFLMHHGDQGLYHEGLGYMAYPASYWLPAVLAFRNFDGTDLVAQFPNIRRMGASLYAAACARPMVSDSDVPVDAYGMKLSWNDDGPGWMQCNVNVLVMHLAEKQQIGALRWMYDRLSGVAAPEKYQSFSPGWAGWFFTLFYYPYDVPAADPSGILPLHYTDTRQGLSIFRNRYLDGEDAILGCYARATFVGGHAQDDAGSVRLMALGHDWITGGGQARPKAEYQSVVTPADGKRREPYAQGAIIWDESGPGGGVFAMDLRKPSIGYAERYVAADFSGACGSPVLLAMLDQIDDHLTRDWNWNLTYEPGLKLRIHDDRRGFTLTASDGTNLEARFLGARPASIERKTTPDSQRTYQGGWSRNYPGRPYVQARFPNQPHIGIYVVMTIQRGAAPAIAGSETLAVKVGGHEWARPFGASIPACFRPGVTGGLCKYPAGVKGFRAG